MNRVWIVAITSAMVVASAAYAVLAFTRAGVLFASGDVVNLAFALAIIVIPVVGCALIARELWFGWRTRQMGRILAAEGGLPSYVGELTASGRPTKEDADRNFVGFAKAAEDNPDSWRAWFRLAIAYDDARDRKRARSAMRQASSLFTRESGR